MARRSGFGLLEGLLALAVFATVFVPLLGVFTDTGARQLAAVRDYSAALHLAERFLHNTFDLLEAGNVDLQGELDLTPLVRADEISARSVSAMQELDAVLEVVPVANTPRLFRVTVRVGWGDRPRRQVEVSGYKYAPQC